MVTDIDLIIAILEKDLQVDLEKIKEQEAVDNIRTAMLIIEVKKQLSKYLSPDNIETISNYLM